MSDQKESSVLFSLKELMNIEEDRIKQEAADKEAKARSEREARELAERTAREAEQRRIREEEERKRNEESRVREEQARFEAIQKGELERARAEAEQKAKFEAMALQQKHEKELEAIRSHGDKKKLKFIIGAAAVLIIGGIGGGVMLYQQNAAETARKEALFQQERDALAREKAELAKSVKDGEAKAEALKAKLAASNDAVEKEKLRLQLQKQDEVNEQNKKKQGTVAPKPDKPAAPKKTCPPGDPLCTEL
jgi:colicin import membrane protein